MIIISQAPICYCRQARLSSATRLNHSLCKPSGETIKKSWIFFILLLLLLLKGMLNKSCSSESSNQPLL